jgi:hypothetical protein
LTKVKASVEVPGRIADAEGLWYDLARWPSFVEGFSHVVRADPEWPASGTLTWTSTPHGRGRVVERVTRHEVRVGQSAAVEDERLRGEQTVSFEGGPGGATTRITIALDYALKERAPLSALTDLFFIRRAVRESLQRTLVRFERERRGDADLLPD